MIHAGSEWYEEQENWRMHIYYGVRRGNEERVKVLVTPMTLELA